MALAPPWGGPAASQARQHPQVPDRNAPLALSDEGAPSFDHGNAAALAGFGIPSFACTPDQFPDLMAAALRRDDVAAWAAARGIVTQRGE